MNWFRRKKREEQEIITNDVPVSTLIRWFLYDTDLMDPNDAAVLVGLNPVSEEGSAKEEQDSDDRIAEIDDLIPFLSTMSEITSTVLANVQAAQIMESNPEEGEKILEDIESMRAMYQVVALASLISTFATAVELGIISQSLVSSTMMDMEDFLDEQ